MSARRSEFFPEDAVSAVTVTPFSPDTWKNPRDGRLVVPGFNDTHMHLLQFSEFIAGVRTEDATSIGMLVEQGAVGERIWYGIEMPVDEVIATFFAETC